MTQNSFPLSCGRLGTLAAAGVQSRGLHLGPSAVRGCGHSVPAGSNCSEVRGTWLISDICLQDKSAVDLTRPFSLDALITLLIYTMKVNMLLFSITLFLVLRSLSQYHLLAVHSRKSRKTSSGNVVFSWWSGGFLGSKKILFMVLTRVLQYVEKRWGFCIATTTVIM